MLDLKFKNLKIFEKIDSTHKYLKRCVENNEIKDECIVVAEFQTDGVGRCARPWSSLEGNLYTSFLKKIQHQKDLGKNSLLIACAIREAIIDFLYEQNKKELDKNAISESLFLHWPNDIYYKDRKISGMLLEVISEWTIISIGINVNNYPKNLQASSLYEITKKLHMSCNDMQPLHLLRCLDKKIEKWLTTFQTENFYFIREYWLRYINNINCNVTIRNGNSTVSGIFKDIDLQGRLVLEHRGKNMYISSGDLFMDQERIIYKDE